jgi:hypothetical protein
VPDHFISVGLVHVISRHANVGKLIGDSTNNRTHLYTREVKIPYERSISIGLKELVDIPRCQPDLVCQ